MNYIRLIIFINFYLLLFSCHENYKSKNIASDTTLKKTLQNLQFTFLPELPDSLQPDTFYLKDMPRSQEMNVPAKSGGFWTIEKRSGEILKIPLEPPSINSLDVLKDKDGKIVLDSNNNPFILGEGGNLDFVNLTSDQGLAIDFVCCMIKDKKGNLWIGTNGSGISKYDGKSFTNFSTENGLAGNYVQCICEDKFGDIWIGTDGGGVSKYDGRYFHNYTTDDGLAGNIINSILKDSKGNLWFGTYENGISKFDGKRFHNFNKTNGLAGDAILEIMEDKNNNIWIGTGENGISVYNGSTFTNYSMKDGLPNNRVSSFCKDKTGKIWIGTFGGGISCFDGKRFKNYSVNDGLAGKYIYSLFCDSKGIIWIGTFQTGLSIYDGTRFKTYTIKQGILDNNIRCFTEDSKGGIWLGTTRCGMLLYKGKAFTMFNKSSGLSNNSILSILGDNEGNMWFSIEGEGVNKYDGKAFTIYKTNQGLGNNIIISIAQDDKGKMYFGSYGGGVSCYDGKKIKNLTVKQGLAHNSIWSICSDSKGRLWFGSNGRGVSCYDGKSFINYSSKNGLADDVVNNIIEDDFGNMWFGTASNGLSVFNHKTFITINTESGLIDKCVTLILKDKYGNIWFGTENGISRILKQEVIKINKLLNSYKSKNQQNKISISLKFDSLTKEGGIISNSIWGLTKDGKNNIFIGTSKGISVIPSRLSQKPFNQIKSDIETFNKTEGYPLKDVSYKTLFCDRNDIVWAGTESDKSAVIRFDYSKVKKEKKSTQTYIQQIRINDENINWHRLENEGVAKDKRDSSVFLLHDFLAFGKKLTADENLKFVNRFKDVHYTGLSRDWSLPLNLKIPYSKNKIRFEFLAIETSNPQGIRYRYILEGNDDKWREPSSLSYAGFDNLYEGNYTFKVSSQLMSGKWSKPAIFNFTILPPWYRTWWAYTFYLLSMLSAIYLVIRWRLSELKLINLKLETKVNERTVELVEKNKLIEKQKSEVEFQKVKIEEALNNLKETQEQLIQIENQKNLALEKTRIARDMHDEIGSGLTQISMLSELIKSKSVNEHSSGELEKLSIKTRELIQNMSQIIWAMNQDNDNLDNLLGYLRKFSMDFFENSKIECKVLIHEINEKLEITQSVRRNILLVVKETFHNILKHSEAEKVSIEIAANDILTITISDNGKGFEPNTIKTFGNGLKNMEKRMDEIGGTFKLISKTGEGSVTILYLKLRKKRT